MSLKALIPCLFLATGSIMAAERSFEKVFDVEPQSSFSLDNHKGHIQVRTDNVAVIQVNARIYFEEEGADESLLDHVNIRTRSSGNSVSVDVDYDDDHRNFSGLLGKNQSWPAVDFDIVLPDDANLRIESHKGSFDVVAPAGRVAIESHKGHGILSNIRSDFKLSTHKGEFKVEILKLADLSVETHKGDVTVSIHDAVNFRIRAETHKGNFSFTGREIPMKWNDGRPWVSYSAGDGSNFIDLETHKGRIALEFLN